MRRPALAATALLLAGCAAESAPASDLAPPTCPDDPAACAEACLREAGEPAAECAWVWGDPACVCGPATCDGGGCYASEAARRLCGTTPAGEEIEACVKDTVDR